MKDIQTKDYFDDGVHIRYVGELNNDGYAQGQGFFVYENGDLAMGTFNNGWQMGLGIRYNSPYLRAGFFNNHKLNGLGLLAVCDDKADFRFGLYKDNYANGLNFRVFPNKDWLVCNYQQDEREGTGLLYLSAFKQLFEVFFENSGIKDIKTICSNVNFDHNFTPFDLSKYKKAVKKGYPLDVENHKWDGGEKWTNPTEGSPALYQWKDGEYHLVITKNSDRKGLGLANWGDDYYISANFINEVANDTTLFYHTEDFSSALLAVRKNKEVQNGVKFIINKSEEAIVFNSNTNQGFAFKSDGTYCAISNLSGNIWKTYSYQIGDSASVNQAIGSDASAMQALNNMIGLSNIKAEIIKLKAIYKKSPNKTPTLNIAFYGNPGTGKTEVARLLAKILHEEGILPKDTFIETDRSGLVGQFQGDTAVKTHKLVQSALGGVLFVDEAYALFTGEKDTFGKEAIDALIKDMEDYRGKMCFIFAGYKQPLLDMFEAVNKGFKSRINRHFDFENYTKDELKEIARRCVKKDGYILSEENLEKVLEIVTKKIFLEDFGNAREVRNVLEKLYEYQAVRTESTNDMEITLDDIESYTQKQQDTNNIRAEEQLHNLIGLSDVKDQIQKLKAILRKNKGNIDKTNLHMCFYGNPGTGKTEVARIIAKILYEEGILPENKYTETDRAGLVGQYQGHTAYKTHKIVKESLGGVLFIDEAYSLITAHGEHDSFGREAVNTLLKDMEDYRGKFCVIMAGYEKEMELFLSTNPGFKSRINRNIVFPDYSNSELMEIAKKILAAKKYSITDEALAQLETLIEAQRKDPAFANARTVRNILESIYEIQAVRTYEANLPDNYQIELCDVLKYK